MAADNKRRNDKDPAVDRKTQQRSNSLQPGLRRASGCALHRRQPRNEGGDAGGSAKQYCIEPNHNGDSKLRDGLAR
jgi:hypothetical protein